MSGITSSNRLYLGSLPLTMDRDAVEQEFKVYGPVQNVWIAKNPPGFGFVEMDNERDAAAALKGMDGREFNGQRMRVEFAKPRSDSGRRGGARGDDRGPGYASPPPASGYGASRGGDDRYDDRRREDPRDDRSRGRDPRDDPRDMDRGARGGRDPRDDPRGPPVGPYAAYAAYYGGMAYPGYPGLPPYGAYPGMPGYPPVDPRDARDSRGPSSYDSRSGGGSDARYPDPRDAAYPPRGGADMGRDSRGYDPRDMGRDSRDMQQRRGVGPPAGREHICFNCNQTGHWAKDCPKPKNQGECYTCGERGHAQRDCPKGRPQHYGNAGASGNVQVGGPSSGMASSGGRGRSRSRSPDQGRGRSRSRSRSRGRGRSPSPGRQ